MLVLSTYSVIALYNPTLWWQLMVSTPEYCCCFVILITLDLIWGAAVECIDNLAIKSFRNGI